VNTASWVVHPLTIIAHRAGRFSLGRMAGTAPVIPIDWPDLVLLGQFLTPTAPDQAATRVLNGPATAYLPGRPDPRALRQRFMQFRQGGVLIDGKPEPCADKRMSLTPDALEAAGALDEGQSLRLVRNFVLRPAASGLIVRSTRHDRDHLIDLEMALALALLGNGLTGQQVTRNPPGWLSREKFARVRQWALDEGLTKPAGKDNGERAAGDYRKQVPFRKATASDWRGLQPDGRIPIYFVPHMENHFPLALGMISSAIHHWNDGELLKRYQPIPISYLGPQQLLDGPYRRFGRGIWMFSNYMWSIEHNLAVSEAVKRHDVGNLTVHGGPSTPEYEQACKEFMARNLSVDIAVHGEGEVAACQILANIERSPDAGLQLAPGLSEVPGITYRQARDTAPGLVRTDRRARMPNPDSVPSPYLEGLFDAYEARVEAAIVETNRGCPFRCTFCDWGSATNQKVSRFQINRVEGELDWIGRNRIGVLWIADANFGMLKRDLEIAETIVEVKRRYGYPQEVVVNYTKNANERLAEIIRVFTEGGIISQGIISIQTTDPETLRIIDRENIRTDRYDRLLEIFSELGLPLSTDLMIGLPGITPEAFDRDLQYYIDADVSIKAYPTQLLPNSPMAHPDYLARHRIETDENGFLVSCASYTAEELEQMKFTYHVYTVADGYGCLRHVLRFLQWEHSIPAIRVINDLAASFQHNPDRYPAIGWAIRYFSLDKCMPGGWRQFFDEVAAFVGEHYGVQHDAPLEVVLAVNEAAMPDEARDYPMTVELAHDYVSYFRDRQRAGHQAIRPLADYPPGALEVSDPNRMAEIDFEYQQYDTHQFFWELHSPVSRIKSTVKTRGVDIGGESPAAAVAD
jgi:radical SAM superfamily enzyme YgiQ (UPF0313 family)